ncbi:hypothetical protein WJX72_010699 [[Myrmecia] bisecta]|uniref:MATH domain-containing protein n=1 Tax=[Myrmecia] bisecta TaxID=41462 RepID=A0AAW1QGG8_9CHLO
MKRDFIVVRSAIDSCSASSSYLEDDSGPKPADLYGKFTWKIENFSEISKRELRSTIFEVGSYKWYILVYPQGCDVCNHLSLFLCVADYDKLLPGWSHFAQFTIAVVNKDPKKSKYSDTLHRFCKKEHDWGWKKFMELNKVLEGFTVSNTLVIKAQVQVIRDRVGMPFRCLDPQYRRELVRVYLTNVEGICRRFVDEKREMLSRLREDLGGFRAFWQALDPKRRRVLAAEKGDIILKGVVKRFFNEKEVTSTLVMDALFSGCKQLEEAFRTSQSTAAAKGKKKDKQADAGTSGVVIQADKNMFAVMGDVLAVLERAATETIPPFRDDKGADTLTVRSGQDVDEYSKDYVERDERRLADLGRRAVEMYAVAHIFSELENAFSEAESIKRQDALIKEEEEAGRLEDERSAARAAVEREKKARKKERRKAKLEAERAKKEAEESEKAAAEAERRAEEQRKERALLEQRKADKQKRDQERDSALAGRGMHLKSAEAAAAATRQQSGLSKGQAKANSKASAQEEAARASTAERSGLANGGEAGVSTSTSSAKQGASPPTHARQASLESDSSAVSSAADGGSTSSFDSADEQVATTASRPASAAAAAKDAQPSASAHDATLDRQASSALHTASSLNSTYSSATALDASSSGSGHESHAASRTSSVDLASDAQPSHSSAGPIPSQASAQDAASLAHTLSPQPLSSSSSGMLGDMAAGPSSPGRMGQAANGEASFSASMLMQQHGMQFVSPMPAKRADPGGIADSPGLDDFAHMGLITDLLD